MMYTEEISQHVDVPAPHISKEHFEVEKLVPHECAFENRCSPQVLDDVPVLQSFEEFTEVERLSYLNVRLGTSILRRFASTCQFHRVFEEFTEVERYVPPECASGNKYFPQIFVDVPVPQF